MAKKLKKILSHACMVLGALSLCACATSSDYQPIKVGEIEIHDPYEDFNRVMFSINEGIDTVILNPATVAYRTVVPEPARKGVSNVLDNVSTPIYLANEILQGDWDDAGLVTKRFLINSTVGIGGLMDVASWEGDEYLPEDFGQTLAVWGVEDGPYFVWPIFGPATTRDSFGRLVDRVFDPFFWYTMNNSDREWIGYTKTGLTILDTKDKLMDAMNDLEQNSLDYYAAVRSVIYQRRYSLIKDRDPQSDGGSIMIPDYDDEELFSSTMD